MKVSEVQQIPLRDVSVLLHVTSSVFPICPMVPVHSHLRSFSCPLVGSIRVDYKRSLEARTTLTWVSIQSHLVLEIGVPAWFWRNVDALSLAMEAIKIEGRRSIFRLEVSPNERGKMSSLLRGIAKQEP